MPDKRSLFVQSKESDPKGPGFIGPNEVPRRFRRGIKTDLIVYF